MIEASRNGLALRVKRIGAYMCGEREQGTYRTVTLHSTRTDRQCDLAAGVPFHYLLPVGRYRDWFEQTVAQMPRVLHARTWLPEKVSLPRAAAELQVTHAWTWLFAMPHGAMVAGLALEFADRVSPGETRPLMSLLHDVDTERECLEVDGRPYLEVCCDGASLDFAGDMHHLTFLPPDALQHGPAERDLVQRLVSRRDQRSRPEYLTARFPPEGNRYEDMVLALTPGASVVGGHDAGVELTLVACAIQALASIASLRAVQREAFQALAEMRGPDETSVPAWLDRQSLRLRDLELELSFGVEAYVDFRILVPSLPVEQYHRELLEALAIPSGSAVASTLLNRLGDAVKVERIQLEERRARQDDRRWRLWSAIGGAVAFVGVPLGVVFGYLGANVEEVSGPQGAPPSSLFDLERFAVPYLVILTLFVIGALAARAVAGRFDAGLAGRRPADVGEAPGPNA